MPLGLSLCVANAHSPPTKLAGLSRLKMARDTTKEEMGLLLQTMKNFIKGLIIP
jgi:hypothetical protein